MSDTHILLEEETTIERKVETAAFSTERDETVWRLRCTGSWTIGAINQVDEKSRELMAEEYPALEVDTTSVTDFDTTGAWIVERLRLNAEAQGRTFRHIDTNARHIQLVEVIHIHEKMDLTEPPRKSPGLRGIIERFGETTVNFFSDLKMGTSLIGASIMGPGGKPGMRGGLRITSIIHQLDRMGLRAVPVIAVMSFLIGAIIAQQGAYQLRAYGEELLTVNLVGILHFREIGVLLTAVMIAGRSGSAITAEIGTMKMREEIDALKVIGLNPIGVLVYPRLVALIIALPILTLLSDVAGIAGAIVVTNLYVGISPQQFMQALLAGVDPQNIYVGLIKAPVMAVIIGVSASIEGLKVGGSSESLGARTTSSVVRSIFAVIVVDGLFAIFFAAIGY